MPLLDCVFVLRMGHFPRNMLIGPRVLIVQLCGEALHIQLLFPSIIKWFSPPDNFELACMEVGNQEDGYFCDKVAYGTFIPVCTVEQAEDYWKTSAAGKWPKFVGDQIVPFMECYNFFVAGKCHPDFPQLGPSHLIFWRPTFLIVVQKLWIVPHSLKWRS